MLNKIRFLISFAFQICKLSVLLPRARAIFFFPFYSTGGAERVHLDIVKSLGVKNSITVFTNHSPNDHFLQEFKKHSFVFDIHRFLRNKYFSETLVAVFRLASRRKNLSFLGCNTVFYYRMLPALHNSSYKTDLLHAFSYPDNGAETFSIPYIKYLDKRIVINKKTKEDFRNLYAKNKIDEKFLERIVTINNAVPIPEKIPEKSKNALLNVVYVGRIAPEKRIGIIVEVASKISDIASLKIYGHIAEDAENLELYYQKNITDPEELAEIYDNADILLISSYREGFPMVIMEAMARGVVCICTDVGGISEHLKDGDNGFLIKNDSDEEKIVQNFVTVINQLSADRLQLKTVAGNAFNYAKENFREDTFREKYRSILLR